MAGSDEDRGRSRKLNAEDRGWSSIGWPDDWEVG
jgi:hypothetical protein